MRFELFLTELPRASASKVEAELAELPKGASTRTILKSMETRNLPTVPVAWSDDKRVVNEVMDTLLELGARCKLVDHGSIVQKLVTWSAEKLGRARYLDDDDRPRGYIKLGDSKDSESWQAALTRHALTYGLQLCLVGVLFVWFVALRVSFARVFALPELVPQVVACATGLLVAYVSTAGIRAVQTGRQPLKRVIPQLVAGACLSLASLFFLGDDSEKEAVADRTVKRPPSLPYAGLLTELRRRKLEGEINGLAGGADSELAGADGAEQAEQELWCDASSPPGPDEFQCRGGPVWEDALACFAEPAPAARPAATKPLRERAPSRRQATAVPMPAAPRPARLEQPWGVTLELSTVVALLSMWLLSLWLLVLLRRNRAAAGTNAPAQAAPEPPSAAPDEAELSSLRAERDALRAQLVEANEATASAQLDAGAALWPDDPPAANTQRELELTRSTLGATQAAFAQLKQQHQQLHGALSAELERLEQELISTREERDLARRTLLDVAGGALGEADLTNTNADDDSSYSVNQVQEERVKLQRRRR